MIRQNGPVPPIRRPSYHEHGRAVARDHNNVAVPGHPADIRGNQRYLRREYETRICGRIKFRPDNRGRVRIPFGFRSSAGVKNVKRCSLSECVAGNHRRRTRARDAPPESPASSMWIRLRALENNYALDRGPTRNASSTFFFNGTFPPRR